MFQRYVPILQGVAIALMTGSILVLLVMLHKLKPFLHGQKEVFTKERRDMLAIMVIFDLACIARACFDYWLAKKI